MFADMFGGSRFLDNLVAQSFNVNRSEYRKMENIWQRELKDGKSVYADIDLNYEGNSIRYHVLHRRRIYDAAYI